MKIYIERELEKLASRGLRRALTLIEGPQGPRVRIGGEEKILLCSNDYLGLANHPEVKRAAHQAIEAFGVGAGASRLVSGNMEPHRRLEERIRSFKGAEAALLFNSGYQANLGLITALATRDTEVFSDRLNHASIVDACILSRARLKRYPHGDISALEEMLRKSSSKRKIVITEGVFSMNGDIAPLKEITGLLDRHNALLLLDDAHGTGVLGANGRGTLEHLSVKHPSIIEMGTLGKALGSFGAFVSANRSLIELLVSRARPFIYTTALPPSVCEAACKAISLAEKVPALRERLHENASYLRAKLKEMGLDTLSSTTQIIPVLVGDTERTMKISRKLLEKGVFIQGIRPPTVPEGTARLRITVTAAHTREDIDSALRVIEEIFEGTFL